MLKKNKSLEMLFCVFLFVLSGCKNLAEIKGDPLFAYRAPKATDEAPESLSSSPKNSDITQEAVPQSRELVLDFFRSDPESQRNRGLQDNFKKLVDLLLLADTFRNDPTYKVDVKIVYKNGDSAAAGATELAKKVVLAKSRKLTQKQSQTRGEEAVPQLGMAFLPGKVPIDPRPKSKFDFPKHFFKLV